MKFEEKANSEKGVYNVRCRARESLTKKFIKYVDFTLKKSLNTRPGTLPGGQFDWGGRLLKSNGGAHKGWLAPDGNRSDRTKP